MRYVCCHTTLYPQTEQSLLACVPREQLFFQALPLYDPFAYGEVLALQWGFGEDFAVIEQDIVIRPDVVEAFANCPEAYCAFPYAWTTNVGPALGCTRFRADFLQRYPNAMQFVLDMHISYRQLDVVLMRRILAKQFGEQPHVHLPPVEHLNPLQRLRPDADPTPMLSVPVDDIGALL